MTRQPPVSEICEVCGERASARRLELMNDIMIWTADLCAECYARELGPVGPDDVTQLAVRIAAGDGTVSREADDLLLRATVHQQTLPSEWRVLIDRHASRPSLSRSVEPVRYRHANARGARRNHEIVFRYRPFMALQVNAGVR